MFQKMLQGGGGGDGDIVLKGTDTSYDGNISSYTYTPTISKGLVEIVFINNAESRIDTITSTGSIEIISKTSYGILAQSPVIPSIEVTALIAIVWAYVL